MPEDLRAFHPDFDDSRSAHIIALQVSGDE
jgi:hypothetical protein